MFIRFIHRLALLFALSAGSSLALADDSPSTELKIDTQAQRLHKKSEDLKQQQEKWVAENDRFYNEITSPSKPTFLEQHGWDLLALAILMAIIIQLFIYCRRHLKKSPRVAVSNHSYIYRKIGMGQNATGESARSEAGSFLKWMGIKSSRRRRHRRHRSHRSQ